ncbi:glycosyltransferase family 4 protein [Aliikangiella maris]|uniref:Glycosyltransferase family 4 protein n=2 Tax=Aliikangiella maris TaxID=3162458 RepID=A0ABV2BRW8_9GAMM
MKKLLITTTTFPTNLQDNQPGFIYHLASYLQNDFQIYVLAPRAKGALENEKRGKIRIIRYAYGVFRRWETLAYGGGILENLKRNRLNYLLIPLLMLAQLFALHRTVKLKNIDLINAHWIIPQGLVAILARKLFKLPIRVVITSHGGDLYGLNSPFLNRIKKWVIENADQLIVVSAAMKDYCYQYLNVDRNCSITVRSMGVDLVNTFNNKMRFAERQNVIFVGRLVEKKGLPILLRAVAILKQKEISLKYTIVGDGPLKQDLLAQVQQLKIEDYVKFVGSKSHQQLPELLTQHQILVMPSVVSQGGDQEGLGLVAIEAMGCGCAVIASDLPAIRDVVQDGYNGLMFTVGDAHMLANKIEFLMENSKELLRLSKNGRESVIQRFDWQSVAGDYQKYFEQY